MGRNNKKDYKFFGGTFSGRRSTVDRNSPPNPGEKASEEAAKLLEARKKALEEQKENHNNPNQGA